MKKKTRSLISLMLCFCMLFSVLSVNALAVEEESIQKTEVTEITDKWDWKTIFEKDGFQISVAGESSKNNLFFGEGSNGSKSFGVINDDYTVTLTDANKVLKDLKLMADNQHMEINSIEDIDDTNFISYQIFPNSDDDEQYISLKSGLISTVDGKNFQPVDFPYQFIAPAYADEEMDEALPLSINKFNDTYIVCGLTGGTPIGEFATYYISTDLKNWTACKSPSFPDDEKDKFQIGDDDSTELHFEIGAVTNSGVYFHAYKRVSPTDYYHELGVFCTSNFKDYVKITEDKTSGYFMFSEHNSALPNGKLAILQAPLGYGYGEEDNYTNALELYVYDETTRKMEPVLKTAELGSAWWWYNIGGFDPLRLYIKDKNKQNIAYSVYSQDKSNIEKYILPYDVYSSIYGAKWTNFSVGEDEFFFDMEIASSGEEPDEWYYGDKEDEPEEEINMFFSDSNWKTAYKVPVNNADVAIKKGILSVLSDNDRFFLVCQDGIIASEKSNITKHLTPLPKLSDTKTGVSLVSISNDEALTGAELAVELLGDDEKATVYDISIKKDGAAIQPNYPVYLKIPIAKDKVGKPYKVYRYEADGSKTEMIAETVDNYIRFATDHFSKYEIEWISAENPTPPASGNTTTPAPQKPGSTIPQTGADQNPAAYLFAMILSLCALFCTAVIGKKRISSKL